VWADAAWTAVATAREEDSFMVPKIVYTRMNRNQEFVFARFSSSATRKKKNRATAVMPLFKQRPLSRRDSKRFETQNEKARLARLLSIIHVRIRQSVERKRGCKAAPRRPEHFAQHGTTSSVGFANRLDCCTPAHHVAQWPAAKSNTDHDTPLRARGRRNSDGHLGGEAGVQYIENLSAVFPKRIQSERGLLICGVERMLQKSGVRRRK
jgi:hypothetical protein